MTITEFLLARIAEDEAAASEAIELEGLLCPAVGAIAYRVSEPGRGDHFRPSDHIA